MKKIIFLVSLLGLVTVQAGVLGKSNIDLDAMEETAAGGLPLVSKQSLYDVDTTVKRFIDIVKSKGFTIFAIVDHAANAHGAGMKLEASKLIVFGKPQGGTKLMHHDMRVGLDLPLKVLVYKDHKNVTLLYRKPETLAQDFDLKGSKVIAKIANALDKFSQKATGK